MSDYSFIANAHPQYIETLYQQYVDNPESVEESWRTFFKGFDYGANGNGNGSANGATATLTDPLSADSTMALSGKEFAVMSIIHGYRDRGHLLSTTNPIRKRKDRAPHLALSDYGLEESDRNKVFKSGEEIGLKDATLGQILDKLNKIYCGNIGFEYAHIENKERRMWLRKKAETRGSDDYGISLEKKKRILEKLNGAVGFEEFLGKKYGPTKRFGLEGGESTIAGIDAIITAGAEDKVEEVVIGMAHRGRLNILCNILGKTYDAILNEFEGGSMPDLSYGSGDVKYHLGYSSQVTTPLGKQVYLKLLPNPSHLEAVDPVMGGFSRAKADLLYGSDYDKILPIMIHGDASVAGQGIVYEVLQMSQLEGYFTGGTIHFVINNQIGFTTDWNDARSSTYCTSIASSIQAPAFHVNGDDPEAVVFVCELAAEYRQQFNSDVFIDMVCYRRNGHNESDNPEVTQPWLYKLIKNHPNPREIYSELLTKNEGLDRELAQKMAKEFDDFLQARLAAIKQNPLPYTYQDPELAWRNLKKKTTNSDFEFSPKTGLTKANLDTVLNHLKKIPDGFKLSVPIDRLLNKGYKDTLDKGKLDWALGELLAYGSILLDGKNVRLSGEDVKRGTFSHRNAVIFDVESNTPYNRLMGMTDTQGKFYIYNSLLSEYGVLGFEYGYSLAHPDPLVIWEAQFGDFANGAQTIIDQFIAAGESKWQRMSGLVLLLPHGYEGQGPEHSSARLERFLQLCGDNNMSITNITTPANFFHAIRRQVARQFRKPLVNMSPKSLLRHPLCISDISEFDENTSFQEVIDDATVADASKISRILFCSGKIYYDLMKRKTETNRDNVAIVRIEQLYPFPLMQLEAILSKYKQAEKIWVQEESENKGAWFYLRTFHPEFVDSCISRRVSASPATGYIKIHEQQQKELVDKAFL